MGWICLGPPGDPHGKGLLYLPEPTIDKRVTLIGTHPKERVTLATRKRWGNTLGVNWNAPSISSWADLTAELLRQHGSSDGKRWGHLLPSKERLSYEVWLGELGRIWDAPAPWTPSTQSFTESWPTDSTTLSSGQDRAWTELEGDLEVASGVLRSVATTIQSNLASCDSTLDTAAQSHTASFTLTDGLTVINQVHVDVRIADGANLYRAVARRRSVTGHNRLAEKRVGGSTTNLIADDAADPGASGTITIKVDGSTITLTIGAYTTTGTDASPQLLTNLKGGANVLGGTLVTDATLDNHTIADVIQSFANRQLILGVG